MTRARGRFSVRAVAPRSFQCAVKANGLALRSTCYGCAGRPSHGQRTLAPRDVLFLEGAAGEHVFPVVEGYLKESRGLPDGRSVTLRLVGPGDVLGTESLAGLEYASTLEAITASRVCVVPKDRAMETLRDQLDQTEAMRKLLERRVESLREQLVLTNGMSAEERVLQTLRTLGRSFAPGAWFKPPLSRRELADHLGIVPETVSRAITRLEKRGVLEVQGRSIRLLDLDAAPGDEP